jgi:eukaryotic-like serine/threonine-protein kinase
MAVATPPDADGADGAHEGGDRQRIGQCVAGKYELTRLIGTGSMGAVYEGVHIDLGKRLAIKVVRPEFCESSEIVARFRREARAASAALSEHIVQIFDFGRDDAIGFYMVSEYLTGEDLQGRLDREGRIEAREATHIGRQVARGLARAHAVGVIHRDLKPANVFLTRRDDGSLLAKILDFGISKIDALMAGSMGHGGGVAEPTLTKRGTTLGTPQYMSPEQCHGREGLDARTDVWSLSAVLYEMLSGQPAISGAGGFIAAMHDIVSKDVCPLAKRAPWVPARLAAVVDAGLARDRDARTPDAATLASGLGAWLAGTSLDAAGGGAGAAAREPSEPPPPSSAEDGVEVFVRSGDVPIPIARKRGRKT